MSARIGKKIENDEIQRSAMENEIALILEFTGFMAENAGGLGLGGTDVSVPPRAPKIIHS